MRRRLPLLLGFLALTSVGSERAFAADAAKSAPPTAKKPASSSLDDELFQDLDLGKKKPGAKDLEKSKTSPVDNTPPVTPPKSTTPVPSGNGGETQPAKSAPPVKRSELDEELLQQLGGDEPQPKKQPPKQQGSGGAGPRDQEANSDNPFVKLSRQVRDAERRLKEADSGEQTQEMQRKIVEDLDKLIAQIEKEQQQKSQSQSQSKKPNAPQQGKQQPKQPKPGNQPGQEADKPTDSGDQLTDKKNEKPNAGKLQDMLEKVWGELPERQRQDVMQASFDDFPAKYQYVIEEYFKTLLKRQD
ncbi:MAG: hypothetical protein C0483_16985 [Pirellula sp.]|nr:hypothetical protein [Pirellula sp.]